MIYELGTRFWHGFVSMMREGRWELSKNTTKRFDKKTYQFEGSPRFLAAFPPPHPSTSPFNNTNSSDMARNTKNATQRAISCTRRARLDKKAARNAEKQNTVTAKTHLTDPSISPALNTQEASPSNSSSPVPSPESKVRLYP